MDTLILTQDNAFKAYNQGTESDKKLLQKLYPDFNFDRDITERIKSFEDVCREAGKESEIFTITEDMDDDERGGIYFRKWALIIKVFKQGWIPDFSNSSQRKYVGHGIFIPGSGFSLLSVGSDGSGSVVGARLALPEEKLYRYIINAFPVEYNDFMTLK